MITYCHIFFDEYPKDSRIRRYTNLLLNNGYRVIVVSSYSPGLKFFEKSNKLIVFRLPVRKKRGSFVSRFFEYFLFSSVSSIILSWIKIIYNPKIFHVHTLPDFLVFSCLIPKLFGSKIILDFHELFPEFMMQHRPGLNKKSLSIKILLFQEKLSAKFSDYIIVFHDIALEILKSRNNNNKMVCIMNGVDENEITSFKKEKSGKFIIIYNGTINFNLNLSIVLDALNKLKFINKPIYDNIEYHLYGKGPEIAILMQKAKSLTLNNVYFHGQVEFQEMVNILKSVSLCILPPTRNVYSDLYYSIKLVEMIYFKIPVIATRLNTYLYYYPENCILYFDSGNVEQLVEKIIFIYENQNEVNHFTNNAFERYRNYNWKLMSDRFINVLKELKY